MDEYPEEKPFAPDIGESIMAVFVGIALVVLIGGGSIVMFMIKAQCYYEAGKAMSGDRP